MSLDFLGLFLGISQLCCGPSTAASLGPLGIAYCFKIWYSNPVGDGETKL